MKARDYQLSAIESIYRYFPVNDGNPLIVLPTGSGKSVVIALFVKGVLERWPGQRILVLTHVKELIAQNFERLNQAWELAPAGIYSAGLNRRDTFDPVIFAGIQSVHNKASHLGHFDLVIIDECHLINIKNDGMYRKFIEALKLINPSLRLIGLTATAFRTGSGDITYGEQRIFHDVAYELPIQTLLDRGHLAPLVSKQTAAFIDTSEVNIQRGEFVAKELEAAADQTGLTQAAVSEIIDYGASRRSWLIFCSGVNHAEHVQAEIQSRGIACGCITGSTPKAEREQLLADYISGDIQALTNANVLTTGFDAPRTDLIAFLRPTCSPGLYVQMAGRGMRPAPGKINCLVLDFAGNVARHGPVDQVRPWIPNKRKRSEADAPTRTCPECDTIVAASVVVCPECGYQWPVEPKHDATASNLAILSENEDPEQYIETVDVDQVCYNRHAKPGKIPSMRVDYYYNLSLGRASEWICFEHTGYPHSRAVAWWALRSESDTPETVEQAIAMSDQLPTPSKITIDKKPKYTEVKDYDFNDTDTRREDSTDTERNTEDN